MSVAATSHERGQAAPSMGRLARFLARPETVGTAGVFVLFVVAWQWGPGALGVPAYIVPTASECWFEFLHMIAHDRLALHVGVTALEVAVGFGLGALLGMLTGFALGMSATAEIVLSPYILALQIAPKVAFAPLFVMWFGYTVYPKILVAVLIVFFPIMVNVLTAIRTIDRDLVNLARSFTASRFQVFWKIEFRAAMPPLFAGLRIGSTLAVIGVVVGELVGGNTGLGYLLTYGEGAADTPMVFVAIILLTLIGIIAYLGVTWLEGRVLHYIPARATGAEGI
jgi:NitT/TauT family transport system permease protein